MIEAPRCDRCQVTMEPGYLVDHGYGVTYTAAWVAGVPKWSRWWGLRVTREQKIPVTTYRCPHCGVLASYTRAGKWPA